MHQVQMKINSVRGVALRIIFAFGLITALSSPSMAQQQAIPQLAPVNPEFARSMQNLNLSGSSQMSAGGRMLGLAPSPVDLSHLSSLYAQQKSRIPVVRAFPGTYDLRTLGKLTPVRDQSNCGSCWAFATMGSLESNLLPGETWNFSENNLKNMSGFDLGHCSGGNASMSIAYFARWSGPISEVADPYSVVSGVSPTGLAVQKHFQQALFLPDRIGPTDNDMIKQALMTYGAMYTSMFWIDSSYSAVNNSYFYNGASGSNHGVVIVGWDDNYSRLNFVTPPPGNGAFIVRNSWGSFWGENGYFYISYYDTKIGIENVEFIGSQSSGNFARIYQHDPLGATGYMGVGGNTAWFANVFLAAANESLSAVSFYALAPNSTYTIKIYTNVTTSPTGGALALTHTGTIPYAGYHTIRLPTLVPLTSGQKFSAAVRITTPGFNFPIPIETPFAGYSGQAVANAGESFYSSDNAGTPNLWSDITVIYANTNVALKAFTAGPPTVTTSAISGTTTSTATGGGVVVSDGGATVTARGVCWATTPNPVIGGTCTVSGTGVGTFASSITGLTAYTTYHVRAYATNSLGTVYGSDRTFVAQTRPQAPTLLRVQ